MGGGWFPKISLHDGKTRGTKTVVQFVHLLSPLLGPSLEHDFRISSLSFKLPFTHTPSTTTQPLTQDSQDSRVVVSYVPTNSTLNYHMESVIFQLTCSGFPQRSAAETSPALLPHYTYMSYPDKPLLLLIQVRGAARNA